MSYPASFCSEEDEEENVRTHKHTHTHVHEHKLSIIFAKCVYFPFKLTQHSLSFDVGWEDILQLKTL